jgi:hypothetical protein
VEKKLPLALRTTFLQTVVMNQMDAFEHNGSGWVLRGPLKFRVRVVKFHAWFNNVNVYMELRDWLKGRKAVINIKNNDDNCFYKCLYMGLVRIKHKNDTGHISMDTVNRNFEESKINISMFKDGFTPEALQLFKSENNIGINIFGIDDRGSKYTTHEYVSILLGEEHDRMVNLGLLSRDGKKHYVLIRNPKEIITEKYKTDRTILCYKCLTPFSTKDTLLNHVKNYHRTGEGSMIKLPSDDKAYIKFDIRTVRSQEDGALPIYVQCRF